MDILVKLSGTAGDGVQSVGDILTNGAALAGINVFNFRSYGAEIRARGNSDATVRMSDKPIYSLGKDIDILLAIQSKASLGWAPFIRKGGMVIFDSQPKDPLTEENSIAAHVSPEVELYGVPMTPIAQEVIGTHKAKNVAALGALVYLRDLPKDKIIEAMQQFWAPKGDKFIKKNLEVLEKGYSFAESEFAHRRMKGFDLKETKPFEVYNGNQAGAKGAIDAGCSVFAGYPITPASPLLEICAKELPKRGGKVIQTEDEIAAIGVVLGASFTGARAMTSTSGPGLSLMIEQLGLSYITEVPCVIVCAQRGGPSTGLPTKTEQSDLNLAVHGAHGDAAKIVLAPTNVYECHTCMVKAFDYAQRYQIPVIVLTDFFLANRRESMPEPFEIPKIKDTLVKPKKSELKDYKRYRVTENGISPMTIPGMAGGYYTATGLEHNETGTPTYTGENHLEQTEKRFRKLQTALKEISDVQVLGSKKAEIGIISWGSTTGAAIEAIGISKKAGIPIKVLKTTVIWPLAEKQILKFAAGVKKVIIPELNYQGQFANLLTCLGPNKTERMNWITGEPITPFDIVDKVKKVHDVLSKES